MKNFIFFILFFYSSLIFAVENPIIFLEKVLEDIKPALINRDDSSLDSYIKKYVSFEEVSLWIAGKTVWYNLDSDKKKIFIDELINLMLKTYKNTIYYYIDFDIDFLKPKIDYNNSNYIRIQIFSVMKKNNKNVTVSFKLIKFNESWLVFDIVIEGISILKSLQTQYSSLIRNYGIDYVIDKMRNVNK